MKKRKSKLQRKNRTFNHVLYLDISAEMEDGLHLIANLLSKIDVTEALDSRGSNRVAYIIKKYLQEKVALDHLFHKRKIPLEFVHNEEFQFDLLKLKKTLKRNEGV